MPELQSAVTQAFIDVALAAIALLATWATVHINQATARLKAETQLMQDAAQAELVQRALDRVNEVATKTVERIEQTTAGTLRQAVKEGKADRATLLRLGLQAYDDVRHTVGPDVMQLLTAELGDVSTYVQDTIESALYKLKASQPASVPAQAAAPQGGGNA